jgi:L-fuculose-phosphate aldolase
VDDLAEARAELAACGRRMLADGLVVGTSGNLSIRHGDLIAVTPTGVPYPELTADDIGVHRLDGTPVAARWAPTSELPLHLAIYAGTAAQAVVHTHAPAATAVSTLVDELPSVHYLVARYDGPVRVAPYATYGSPELAARATAALDGRTGCLLGNHGTVTIGGTLEQAYDNAVYLEWLCDVWLRARSAGTPRTLPPEEIERVRIKLASYGPAATPGPR